MVAFSLSEHEQQKKGGVQGVQLEPLTCERKHATVSCKLQAVKMAYS